MSVVCWLRLCRRLFRIVRQEGAVLLSRWPIRHKYIVGIVLLIGSVIILFGCGLRGVYAFRGLARGISRRASELPIAVSLAQHTSALKATVTQASKMGPHDLLLSYTENAFLNMEFTNHLENVERKLTEYRNELTKNRVAEDKIGQVDSELAAADEMKNLLTAIRVRMGGDELELPSEIEQQAELLESVSEVNQLAAVLPGFLQTRMNVT